MLTVDEARAKLAEQAGRLPAEAVSLDNAAGLVMAEDILAGRDLPGFDNSAMDGYAVKVADLEGASRELPARLRLAGEVAAGSVFHGEVAPGTAVRIMTGAPIPAGAEAVLEVEDTEVDGADVLAFRDVEPGRSFRLAGTDIRQGELALAAGSHIGPAQVALLAALGEVRPTCVRRPRVAVLATGDELVDAAAEPGPGQVVDVASPALKAAIEGAGATAVIVERAADRAEDIRRALGEAAEADLVVSVGGVSMGARDMVRPVVEEMGRLHFWRVAMRPGKPLAVGEVGGRPFIGLPGNPVSALVGFEVYVLPTIMSMSGRTGWARPRRTAILSSRLRTPKGLRTFARAVVRRDEAGRLAAEPLAGQGSYQVRSMGIANALLDVPEDVEALDAGAGVEAILVNQPPAPQIAS
jgi:molybdopterin molybdotransferase